MAMARHSSRTPIPKPYLATIMLVLYRLRCDTTVGHEGRVGERHLLSEEDFHLLCSDLDLSLREAGIRRPFLR